MRLIFNHKAERISDSLRINSYDRDNIARFVRDNYTHLSYSRLMDIILSKWEIEGVLFASYLFGQIQSQENKCSTLITNLLWQKQN